MLLMGIVLFTFFQEATTNALTSVAQRGSSARPSSPAW